MYRWQLMYQNEVNTLEKLTQTATITKKLCTIYFMWLTQISSAQKHAWQVMENMLSNLYSQGCFIMFSLRFKIIYIEVDIFLTSLWNLYFLYFWNQTIDVKIKHNFLVQITRRIRNVKKVFSKTNLVRSRYLYNVMTLE